VRSTGKRKAVYTVLLIDDDEAVLETTAAILEAAYLTKATTSPKKALEMLHSEDFQVAVCDWMMPEMDGIQFFARAWVVRPLLSGLIISGRAQELATEVDRERRKMLGVLAKPFTPEQLMHRVDQLARMSAMKRQVGALKGRG
jgi:DNA-binding NtrC family response regulator